MVWMKGLPPICPRDIASDCCLSRCWVRCRTAFSVGLYTSLSSRVGNSLGDGPAPQSATVALISVHLMWLFPCGSCLKVYIGRTGRSLDHRLKEHRRALAPGNIMQLAVADHATKEMQYIDWEKAEVVDGPPHYRQRCALEAWHIRTEPHTMNRDEGPLPTVYNLLIQQLNQPGWEPLVDSVALFFVYILFIFFIYSPRNPTACFITLASHHFIITLALRHHHHCHFFPPLYTYKSHLALYCRLSIHWRGPWIGSKHLKFGPLTSVHVILG